MLSLLPIVERELQVASRQPRVWWFRLAAAAAATLLAILVFLANTRSSVPLNEVALMLVNWEGVLAWIFCWFAGLFLTADSLSAEKREGTLGLLFLTDLKGHDIVLGKLVASSLVAVYTLLAIVPLLGLPLLAGGVTGGELLRLLLAFFTTLFLSIGIGMFSSARSTDARHAFVVALALLTALTLAGPVLALFALAFTKSEPFATALLGTSPVGALDLAFDASYRTGNGAVAYWTAVSLNLALTTGALVWASRRLPHSWQLDPPAPSQRRRRPGSATRMRPACLSLHASGLDATPFAWLAGRDRSGRALLLRPIIILLLLWLVFLVSALVPKHSPGSLLAGVFFLPYFMHTAAKLALASESTRQLQDDHRSGALELLLVTPLPPEAILAGLRRAARRRFLPAVGLLISVNLVLLLLVNVPNLWDLPAQLREWFTLILIGGSVALLLDARALFWVGLWSALRHSTHSRAVVAAVLRVLLPAWIGLSTVFIIPVFAGNSLSDTGVHAFICVWFLFGSLVSLAGAQRAQVALLSGFRRLAAGERAAPAAPSIGP